MAIRNAESREVAFREADPPINLCMLGQQDTFPSMGLLESV